MQYRASCSEPRSVASAIASAFSSLPIRVLATIVEQVLFAGTNFVVTILLLRWMAADEMGAYSFGFAIFLLFLVIFEALVVEPIPIFGPAKYASKIRAYTGAVLCCHIAVATLVTLCLVGLAVLFYSNSSSPLIGDATLGAALAAPFLFLRLTTQQLCYTHSLNGAFALAGIVYSVEAPSFIYLLHVSGMLTPISAFAAMGLATAIPCLLLIAKLLRPELQPSRMCPVMRQVMLDHWRYGRWSSITQVSNWIGTNIYFVLGPSMIGLDATAAIRAIFNVVMPIQLINNAILWTFVPMLARFRFSGEGRRYHQLVWLLATGLLILTGVYCVALLLGGPEAIHFLYRGVFDHFVTFPLIASLGVILVLAMLNGVLEMQMRISGKIKWVAAAKSLQVISTMTIGVGACAWLGLLGVFIGWAFSSAVLLAANTWYLTRRPATLAPGAVSLSQTQRDRVHVLLTEGFSPDRDPI
jgi:O-antigen/teichoic acid export membrane protein